VSVSGVWAGAIAGKPAPTFDRTCLERRGQWGSWTSVNRLITPMITLKNRLPHRRNLPLDQRLERPQQRLE